MPSQPIALSWPKEVEARNGVIVAGGYGLRISLWKGRLKIEDGSGANRQSRIVHRAASGLRRLVVLGHTGSVSLEVFRWLADIKAAYLQIDADGRVLAAVGPLGTNRPSLRRAQALAAVGEQGISLSRWLVDAKLEAQAANLKMLASRLPVSDTFELIEADRSAIAGVDSVDELRLVEAAAAATYWQTLAPLPVRFAHRDEPAVPKHWRSFGSRSSPLASGPRMAVNPANAILNYVYALLEAEASLAARLVGLDPGLGVMHADQDRRDSLAADLMEPVRPIVDSYVIDLIRSHSFSCRDFHETRGGVCRVTAPLTHQLAESLPHWRAAVGRVAEDLARALDRPLTSTSRPLPTPITGRRRAAGTWAGPRVRKHGLEKPAHRCSWCGNPALPHRRTCSVECQALAEERRLLQMREASSDRMKRLAASPGHPAQTREANERRRATRREQRLAEVVWDREHRAVADPARFTTEILPRIQRMSAVKLAELTGMSVSYCAAIRRGERTPHPRWWAFLQANANR